MDNLVNIPDISEAGIAQHLHERFKRGQIYTRASDVLVAVNGFVEVPKNTESILCPDKKSHIIDVAKFVLKKVTTGASFSESIVFGGESSSGKSTNAYQVLNFLTSEKNSKILPKQAEAIQTVLTSFGCAKTLKNDKATRYGILIELFYQKAKLSGLNLKNTVPLEVSRVIAQKQSERNFNIFYELYHGLNDDVKSSFGIRELQKFFYINQGNQADNIQADENNFSKLESALSLLGFSDDHKLSIFKIISTILHIGNVYFRAKRNINSEQDTVEIGNSSEVKWIAYLLDVDYEVLVNAMLNKTADGNQIALNSALDNRDSLAMFMYEELFKWIISKINANFKCPVHSGVISIIDNYGFEKYNNNGLEEFLINSVNERIENLFVKHTFHDKLVDYMKDGVTIDYQVPSTIENGKVVELLFKKPYGLLSLLTDECKFPKGTNETYLEHCNLNHMDRSSYGKPRNKERLEFGVRHSAGTTWYALTDFFRKNKRSIPSIVLKTLCASRNAVISMLFSNIAVGEKSEYFVSQAQLVMKGSQEIAEKINSSHVQFVRCIKSNNERLPMKFDIPMVNRQIKSLLLAELINFRIRGYPVQIPKTEFARQYRCLLPGDIAMCQNEKEIIQDILQGQGIKFENDYKIGSNNIFLRERLADRYECQQCKICNDAAIIIQKNVKSFVARKSFLRKRTAIIRLQSGLRGWRARRDYLIKREEMFKAIGRTVKRNKRLAVYHEALEGDCLPESLEPRTLVGYIDIDENAQKQMNRVESDSNTDATEITNSYLTIPMKHFLPTMKSISLEQYAEENFKGHLLEPRREPIMTPFLHKESEYDFHLSVEVFKLVLKYMNDRKLSKTQRDDLGRYIVQQGILNPCQRDEIIVQIINQANGNQDKIGVEHCWKLLHMALSVFPPTENLIPMLIGVFNEQNGALRNQLFDTLQRRLRIYDSEISRELAPSNLELRTNQTVHNTVAEIHCYDNAVYDVHINPWITTNEVAERVMKQRGVGTAHGWTVAVETPTKVYAPTGTHFMHDVFSHIDGIQLDSNESPLFFNFPPEKLVKPKPQEEVVVEKNVSEVNKPARHYPTPEEWMNQPPLETSKQEVEDSDESLIREFNEEAEYSYTLPKKCKTPSKPAAPAAPPPPSEYSSDDEPEKEKEEDYQKKYEQPTRSSENVRMTETVHDNPHILMSPKMTRKTYSRNDYEEYQPMNFAPPPTFTYPPQMPIMQYVPVMMHQPMMAGQHMAMIPQPIVMQPHFNYTPQYPQIPQYAAPEPVLSPQSVRSDHQSQYEHDSMRSRGYPRPRRGDIPSQFSTIRNMPVPENGKDVDKFLDAVFDQCLSKDEQRNAEISAKQLASSIKGGRNGPRPNEYYEPDYNRTPSIHQQYLYQSPRQMNYDSQPIRSRAKSLPRHLSPVSHSYDNHHQHYTRRPQSRNSYSDESTSSDDHHGLYHQHHHVKNREHSLPRYNPESGTAYNYNSPTTQPVYMMMPMQMNGHGEMVMMSPTGSTHKNFPRQDDFNGAHDRSRRHARGAEKYMTRRSPSVDILKPPMIRRTPDGIERIQMRSSIAQSPVGRQTSNNRFDNSRTLSRSDSRERERMEPPMMTRQIPRRVDYHYQNGNGGSVLNGNGRNSQLGFRSPSPAPERKGLNRLPVETYTDPAIKSTANNTEYLNPHRFNLEEEKAVIRAEKEIAKDALAKLNSQLKLVPPPIDNVRFIRGQKPAPVKAPLPAPEPVIVVRPPPPPVQPTPPPQPRQEWVIRDSVERAPETQERVKGASTKDVSMSMMPKQTPIVEKSAVKYVRAPWKLTIRKEMFFPGEVLNDIQVIDQIFAQIVEDCQKSYPYRIRFQDRKQVEDVLRFHHIPPTDLNHQQNIHPDIKVEVIEKARHWPLYFNQIYEVVEKRPDESIGILFAISEHGIRLLMHTPHDAENKLKIQDHFPFETVVDVSLESNDLLAIHLRHEDEKNAYSVIRIKTNQAIQIKKTLEKCLNGGVIQKRKFVRAIEDYMTSEANHLSFKRGDIIELLPIPEGEIPPTGDWLYGRIENRFGYLLAQYVDTYHTDNVAPLRIESNTERNEQVTIFDDEVPFSSVLTDKYTMLNFAMKYFRQSKDKKKLEDWTWSELAQDVKFSDRPMAHSLLKSLTQEEDKHAVETFIAIMKFMGDEPLKKSESMSDVVFTILLICHRHPNLRDEVYCQLIKQTTSNVSRFPDSAVRGWRLMSIITSYFPSTVTLKPYLLQYLGDNADDVQRQFHGTAGACLQNIVQTFKYGGRKVLLNPLEVQNTTDGRPLRRQQFFVARDHSVNRNLRPITVAEEMIQELCDLLNVLSLSEQQEFSLCYTTGKDKRLHYCKNDEYLMDIITELEHKKQTFQFYLKRTVWVHPMRFDNTAYLDSMFDQVIDDYLRGSTISTNAHGQLTAAKTEEIIKLAAYLFLLLPDHQKTLTTKQLPQVVPRAIIEPKHRQQEDTVNRINYEIKHMQGRLHPSELKGRFLQLLSTWPLFGVTHFRLKSAVEDGNSIPEVVLSIGKSGVQLLQPKSQEVYKHWTYDKIVSVESVKKTAFKHIRLITSNLGEERTLEGKTDEAEEIAHLIGQYICVVHEKADRGSTEL